MKKLLLCALAISAFAGWSQKGEGVHFAHRTAEGFVRCASTEYEAMKTNMNVGFDKEETNRIIMKQVEKQANDNRSNANVQQVLRIPVVVHVIHNGDAIGQNENIPDGQVLSQITVLNQDFRRMAGTPGYNTNAVGADTEIEFCLAKVDPEGNPTSGINRVQRSNASYNMSSAESMKTQTIWDPDKYLNIWVVNLSGDLLGYAQFPSNSTSASMRNTDGVVIGYRYFGSQAIFPGGNYSAPYNRGRTCTHEVGHFLGLYHIWGDNSSCTVNASDSFQDYCPDTPAAAEANGGCPTNRDSCPNDPGNDMVQNYMDYTQDSCMNIFTQNQKARMRATLTGSLPRRSSLINSDVCEEITYYENDGALNDVELNQTCTGTIAPAMMFVNRGTNNITNATIQLRVNNSVVQTQTINFNMVPGQLMGVYFDPINLSPGTQQINLRVSTVNGVVDGYAGNDNFNYEVNIAQSFESQTITLELQRDLYARETAWNLKNSSGTVLYSSPQYNNQTVNQLPALITQTWELPINDCYTFTITDSEGDGICCGWGQGFFRLYNGTGASRTLIHSGGNFGSIDEISFGIQTLSEEQHQHLNSISIYPNPTKDILNISMGSYDILPEQYTIFNALGQIVKLSKVHNAQDLTINTSDLSNGVYLIRISKDNESKTLQFIKN